MKKRRNIGKGPAISRYHINIFSTNLFAIVIAVIFMRTYVARGYSLLNSVIVISAMLVAFMLLVHFLLKPWGKVKNLFPDRRFMLLNFVIALLIGLLFLDSIGLMGLLFLLIFTFLLYEAEHIIYEGMGR